MDISTLFSSDIYSLIILPLFIFFIRICDVSLGTIRIIFISKGMKFIAPMIGFFEVLIWLLAIRQIMTNLTNPLYFVAYAGGFAMGTYIGMYIENKLSIGTVIIRVITRKNSSKLIESFSEAKYKFSIFDAKNPKGNAKLIFTIVKRQNIKNIVKLIKEFSPNAFYTIEDIKYVSDKTINSTFDRKFHLKFFGFYRK